MANGETTLNTGGGASVGNNVQTDGGAFVGRDQTNINVNVINWAVVSAEFVASLKNALQSEEKEQEDLEKVYKVETDLAQVWAKNPLDKNTTELKQKIIELRQKITESNYFDWTNAEQVYLAKVHKLYNRVRILGNSVDVPLGEIFTQVYILDKPTARQRYAIDELYEQSNGFVNFQQPGQRVQGLALVKTNRNLFILGKPGAGKTTFLKYITIQAAHKLLPKIPIFVSLNEWADSRWGKGEEAALLPFLVKQFDICDFPDASLFIDYLLREGRALVLFDGLDEVKQENDQRSRLTYLLQEFARKYDKSQYLITCRIAASDYAFSGFADVEVADFTADQVHEYARNWFGAQKKKFAVFITELVKPEHQGLAELCNTPLLLSLLCLTFDNNMRFPPSRAELYEDALDTLLRKWDSSRQIQRDEIYRTLSFKRKLQLLMHIAVPTFEKGEIFFRQRELEQWIVGYLSTLPGVPVADDLDGTAILKAIEAQHGILVERAHSIYSFSHLTFQEYLIARYTAENQGRGVVSKLIHNFLTDRRWREAFLLTTSLLADANEFISIMKVSVERIIIDNYALHKLLVWAYNRTKQANVPVEQRAVVQLAYISLLRPLALGLDRTHTLVNALSLELALALDFASTLDLDLSYDRGCDLASERALSLAHMIARVTAPIVGFDYGLYYIWVYATLFANEEWARIDIAWQAAMQELGTLVEGLAILANAAGLADLAQHMVVNPIPLPSANAQIWRQYADTLFTIMHDEREMGHEWTLSDKEINKLNDYFYANELLVQCLKVAAVSDRQAVLNGLLLPPADLTAKECNHA